MGKSLIYRGGRNKWNKIGLVFFCSKDKEDRNNLVTKLQLVAEDNSDKARPYAVFIPDQMVEAALEILMSNTTNMTVKRKSAK